MRRTLSLVGWLQIGTLLCVVIAIGDLALAVRHETDDYFAPLATYLGSFKIALPPVAIFAASYVVAFVTGASVTDAPKTMLAFCRNRLLQSVKGMVFVIGGTVVVTVYCAHLLLFVTPPAYERFVEALLGGSSDSSLVVKSQVDEIGKANPALAQQLSKIVEVFAERSAVNAGAKPLSTERAKLFVRSLEAHVSSEWDAHPLRQHGLAEAYLLYAQSAEQAGRGISPAEPLQAPFERAVALYQGVIAMESPLAPSILKASARNNLGNAYYYMGSSEKALAAWRDANSVALGGKTNLSSWGNIVAALVLLDQQREAILEGEKAKEWAAATGKALTEPYAYAGVLGNLAFAKLEIGNTEGALADFATAHALQGDDLTRQNLALALILGRRYEEAQETLRQIAPPANLEDEADVVRQGKIARCVYLIWALAIPKAAVPDRAANLVAFLGEAHSRAELNAYAEATFSELEARTLLALPKAAPPCGSLGKIKAITTLLHPE